MKTVNNSPPPTVTIKLTAGGDCIVSLAQEMLYQDPVVVASLSKMVVSAVTIRAGHLHLLQIQILSDAAAAWLDCYILARYTLRPESSEWPMLKWAALESIFEWSQGWI